ncbi:MAG: Crp/Fnr family transcriptional regulator, partial [Chloroflexi bacterium]|nr:Crp/Fnr family transcriptional regulator [Chloroflexota bacterium]
MYVPRFEPVFKSGDTATAVYVVRQGIIVVGIETPDTRHVVTAVHGPGRAFGWSCVLQGLARPVSALALTDCTAWSIPSGLVRGMAESDPGFAGVIYKNMAQRGLRALFTLASQMRSPAGSAEKLERCPMLL